MLALWCALVVAGAPSYGAFSEPDGLIRTEEQERAAWAMLHDPDQVEAVVADAARGNARAERVLEQLEATLAASGRQLADRASAPDCLVPAYRELRQECRPSWAFIGFLSQDRPGGIRLRSALLRAFAARARERGMQNQLILSVVNGLLSVALIGAVLEGGGVGTVSNVTRLNEAELETGKRLSRKLGVPLAESPHQGEEFVDPARKTYDALGDPAASKFWNEKEFIRAIDDHLLKSVDYVVIDMTGFTPAQIGAVERHLATLKAQPLARIIRIGF